MNKVHKTSALEIVLMIFIGIAYISTLVFVILGLKLPLIASIICQTIGTILLFYTTRNQVQPPVDSEPTEEENPDMQAQFSELQQQLSEQTALYEATSDKLKQAEEENNKLIEEMKSIQAQATASANATYDLESVTNLLPQITDYDKEHPSIDILEIARNVVDELSEEAQKAKIQVQVASSSDSLFVKAAPSRIRIMFRNIVDNSIKYMQQSGVLVITISNIGSDIFIVLKDNGQGLSQQETGHIFELNYQGSNRISGNGLGLTQSKAIVEHYGGTIYAKSTPNQGMGIYIQLPTS